MTFPELIEAYAIEKSVERTRDYMARGRPLSGLSGEMLRWRWVGTYRAVHGPQEDERREGELLDLRSEFDLRGVKPPMHLVAAEVALLTERFKQKVRDCPASPAEVDKLEAELADLCARLKGPKN